jgi:hypothetical protein
MRLQLTPLVAIAALSASVLQAQTADQARLVFSVGVGQSSGGGTLWSVGKQPFIIQPNVVDTFALTRTFRRSLNLVLSGTYFPGDHLGFNVEAQLLGLATEDSCRGASLLTVEGDSLCRSIGRRERSGSSAALSGGLIYRVASHQPLHPYVRANAGLLLSQESFVRTAGQFGNGETTIYDDQNPSTVKPYLSFGGGVVAVIGKGYQFRFELRDNWVQVTKVTGATSRQGLRPPTETVGKHILTATIGFDVVLERKRGRRY